MNSRTGRIAFIAVGVGALVMGGIFAGQALNLIPGSFMTGNRIWLPIGLLLVVVGIVLLVEGVRRRGRDGTNT